MSNLNITQCKLNILSCDFANTIRNMLPTCYDVVSPEYKYKRQSKITFRHLSQYHYYYYHSRAFIPT